MIFDWKRTWQLIKCAIFHEVSYTPVVHKGRAHNVVSCQLCNETWVEPFVPELQ